MGYWGYHSNQGDGPLDSLAELEDGETVATILKEGRDGVGAVLQYLLDGKELTKCDIQAAIEVAESFRFQEGEESKLAVEANEKEIAFFKSCLETGKIPEGTTFRTPGLFETMGKLIAPH